MAGGLMQLVAYGAQDIYLTGNPKVTFFQARYQRHTNFAMETIEQTVNGSAGNNGRLSVTIARNGDLVGEMYCTFETNPGANLSALAWQLSAASLADNVNVATTPTPLDGCWVAERAVSDIELSIGGQRIDKHYQKWWRLYSELYLDSTKKDNWGAMTSCGSHVASTLAAGRQDVVTLPLIFFFNRNPGMYLPLIALQYHEVRLDIELASNFATYFSTSGTKVWANYIYLDTEERRRFSQKGHEYLIEQVQHTGADSTGVSSGAALSGKTIRLSYNHPVKELVWCHTAASSLGSGLWDFTTNACDIGNSYTVATAIPLGGAGTAKSLSTALYSTSASGAPKVLSVGTIATGAEASLKTSNALIYPNGSNCAFVCGEVSSKIAGSKAEQVATGPLTSFKLILNGQDRMKEQDGKYFNVVQPYYYHSGKPLPGIYSYSFALKPEDHQPTGTCNFSRIDNAQFQFSTRESGTKPPANTNIHMFAVNYNVLRIQSGMGGLAFSN